MLRSDQSNSVITKSFDGFFDKKCIIIKIEPLAQLGVVNVLIHLRWR